MLTQELTQSLETNSQLRMESRVQFTQKEVRYVQQKVKSVVELQLRRIMSDGNHNRGSGLGAASVVPTPDRISTLGVLPLHENLALQSAHIQLGAFSGGALIADGDGDTDAGPLPLWLALMLDGKGLRRMDSDTFDYASRATRLVGIESLENVSGCFISDPWKAYRLGLFPLALELAPREVDPARAAELRLRVKLATHAFEASFLDEIFSLANSNPRLRISLLSSAMAYASKQGKAAQVGLVTELETWLTDARASGGDAEDAHLIAQVLNAVNLVYLKQGKMEPISAQMGYLLEKVTPQIVDPSRRAHVEGNAHYQRSILARMRGDRAAELDSLLTALDLDRGFATLYYRMAQCFHDQGDARAEPFYEMALALSPLDHSTANDYGCYLSDSGKTEKLESWTTLCRALYPEKFAAAAGDAT